jgi:hypothetical protein
MRNRPGRIFYMIDFSGLDTAFVREYCEDNLNNKEHINSVCNISTIFNQFNFDMLKAMVEDMNRYGETPQEVIKLLNAKPEFSSDVKFDVTLQVKGLDIEVADLSNKQWNGNPLTDEAEINWKSYETDEDDAPAAPAPITGSVVTRDWSWDCAYFSPKDLLKVDAQNSKFIFVNEEGERLVLTRAKERVFHYDAF